jgi:imidazolonepropionase-like amidohydrolase
MFLEDRIGSIEVGKEADLAVWDRNPYTMPPAALKDLSCEMTFVRGKAVYRKDRDGGRRPGNQLFALGEEAHAHEER